MALLIRTIGFFLINLAQLITLLRSASTVARRAW